MLNRANTEKKKFYVGSQIGLALRDEHENMILGNSPDVYIYVYLYRKYTDNIPDKDFSKKQD